MNEASRPKRACFMLKSCTIYRLLVDSDVHSFGSERSCGSCKEDDFEDVHFLFELST